MAPYGNRATGPGYAFMSGLVVWLCIASGGVAAAAIIVAALGYR